MSGKHIVDDPSGEQDPDEFDKIWLDAPTLEVDNVFDPASGMLIDGTYQSLKRLGEGGMGGVVLAHDRKLDRDVAIKYILPNLLDDQTIKNRFFSEAKAMARLCHDNVARIYAIGEVQNTPYFVMEYISGKTLSARLQEASEQPVRFSEALHILEQLSGALDAIHEAGLVHGDVKPDNILLTSGFRVVLTDFGLAHKLGKTATANEQILGTPAYMCPELTDTVYPGPAGDIYSLAVVTYELFTGRLPFQANTPFDFMIQHTANVPPHPSEIAPSIPIDVGAAVMQGLRKRPEERPATAGALFRMLIAAKQRADSRTRGDRPMRFVIADDDDDLRELLSVILESAFPTATIESFCDGESAFDSIRKRPPTCALIDLQMPGLNGIELTASIRADERNRDTQVVVMTAVGGAQDWRILSTLGANAFIVKPFEPSELVDRVHRLLGDLSA